MEKNWNNFVCRFLVSVAADQSISQISPKSEDIPHFDDDAFGHYQSSSSVVAAAATEPIVTTIQYNENRTESENIAKSRVLRSASPILNSNEQSSQINSVELEQPQQAALKRPMNGFGSSGRYFNVIQPTSTMRDVDSAAQLLTSARSDRPPSFLLKRGPRLIPSTSPSRPPALSSLENDSTSIKPTRVMSMNTMEMQTANGPNLGRQNPNPDIQDIITGIVKLLNGNVNVHANTQQQPSRRPHTRINNRGPPRISDAAPLSDEEYEQQNPTPAASMRPPISPYHFDRPDAPPLRPFMSGVPLPEQIVPPSNNNNYRPGFVSSQQQQQQQNQNRVPWQRPRPRPPIMTNPNRRPILTPPPYKYTSRPTQELRPPDLDAGSISIAENINASFEDTQLLANEHLPAIVNETLPSTSPNPSKDELTKKKDKLKKPTTPYSSSMATTSIRPTKSTDANVLITTPTATSLRTIIQTTSEVHSSQSIQSSTASLEPSEHLFTSRTPTSVMTSTSNQKTPELLRPTIRTSSLVPSSVSKTSQNVATTTQSKPSVSQSPNGPFHPRPGIVLDDPEFKPGGQAHVRPTSAVAKPSNNIQPTRVHPSNLPPGFGEIFDVTLSAIQGPGNKGANSGMQTINIKPYGVVSDKDGNDIITASNGDDSFVSIDGKRTYINLFGESTQAPNQLPLATKTTSSVTATRSTTIQPTKTVRIVIRFLGVPKVN